MAEGMMTPEGWRCAKQKEHLQRARWHDYQAPSIQLLTLVTTDRRPLLGELCGEQIALSPLGKSVAQEIARIPSYHGAESIEIRSYVVMPDHVHILLQVHDRLPQHLGQYIRWFKKHCSEIANQGTEATTHTPASPPPPLFAPEYHDRLLSGKHQLTHMTRYIQDNPHRLAMKRANPGLFRIRRQTRLGGILCSTLGNIFLADYPERAVLQCSRRLTPAEIEDRKHQCLAEAANGTVFITAAISEGEKQISRALREAGHSLIILLENGFPAEDSPHARYFKPKGVYFEACSAGKLLLVEPVKESVEIPEIVDKVESKAGHLPHDSQRFRFLAMNAIAEKIATEGSAG
ncbi:MAG: transposase [Paludibacteraceae bacterium]|nr:transposase [Paludibacteraceae bacterium]